MATYHGLKVHLSAWKAAVALDGGDEMCWRRVVELHEAGRIRSFFANALPAHSRLGREGWVSLWVAIRDTAWFLVHRHYKVPDPYSQKRAALKAAEARTATTIEDGVYTVGDFYLIRADRYFDGYRPPAEEAA
jgi:hypothetical protein